MKLLTRHSLLLASIILGSFLVILFACSLFFSQNNPNPTSNQVSESISTTPTSQANTLITYTNSDYTIKYPKNWVKSNEKIDKTESGKTIITIKFSERTQGNTFSIGVVKPNPPDENELRTQVPLDGALQGFRSSVKNYQKDVIAPQTNLSGQTWDQTGASGDDTTRRIASKKAKVIALACNYPDSAQAEIRKLYYIVYGGPSLTFDRTNRTVFQPMLQSFLFS